MNKAVKVLLIIALFLGVFYIGYTVISKSKGEKIEQIDSQAGLSKYLTAAQNTILEKKFTVSYSSEKKDNSAETKENGLITIDNYGFYKKWSGTDSGNLYVVKVDNNKYGEFRAVGEEKKSSLITAANYIKNYGDISGIDYLDFLNDSTIDDSEIAIRNDFYSSYTISKSEITNVFGMVKDSYVLETTYICIYTDNGSSYSSKLVRKIYFNDYIEKISFEMVDKELNSEGKVNKKGEKRTTKISYNIEYNTNYSIIESNCKDYPRL